MAAPPPRRGSPLKNAEETPQRPEPTAIQSPSGNAASSTATLRPETNSPIPKKKRNHRGGKKKRRRKSFAASTEDGLGLPEPSNSRMNTDNAARASFYRLQGRNLSNTSIESEALLDHREQQSLRPRRASTMGQSAFGIPLYDSPSSYRPQYQNPFVPSESSSRRPRTAKKDSDDEDNEVDERAPLLSSSARAKSSGAILGPGNNSSRSIGPSPSGKRSSSKASSRSRKKTIFDRQSPTFPSYNDEYNVNYPPSVPGSPTLGASNRDMSFGDMMVRDDFAPSRASMRDDRDGDRDNAIDDTSMPGSPHKDNMFQGRRHTIALEAEGDVCFPIESMSEMAEEDMAQRQDDVYRRGGPRRRRGKWPDLAMLDEWSRFEKEGRSEERRAKKITEPQLIGGRLRPIHKGWHRAEDDAPYRFTYFNEDFQSTIHSQTISELVQPGGSFRELFIPDPPELSDSSDSEDEEPERRDDTYLRHVDGTNGDSRVHTRQGSLMDPPRPDSRRGGSLAGDAKKTSGQTSGAATPNGQVKSPPIKSPPTAPSPQPEKSKRYGDRPTWWLDVLSPTDAEMKVLSKTFGIHPLTAEDIMMQEAREKVELFRNYYFVNYRSFEQDMNNEDFLEPVNMYVVVFREGVISFHFSLTPHPANVRRRIRQLSDYLILSSDWISYAIIDDITDVFAPLIQNIEDEVDDIDDAILKLHAPTKDEKQYNEKQSDAGDGTSGESGGDMLRRVGDCRKKVMGLYRLLGNKADVIKGFAKRCNEHWEIAPRSEIGLYLGDIQDHIVTMTGNLSHYEKILARSHANYLAQINIRMNERQEQTADVLGKLTVLGTIVLPMNIITGLWGMNVWVPGQQYEGDLTWFWCLTAGLLLFGMSCFFTAKWLYKIV
ncbi:CorA metal ion transporter [Cadophora gregata]|uniref:CorA metal ion transporter n=1 Tax=Cadophora gregata TaxID=51156 RepID=UPI0026DD9DE0|nr:CorA metal ion transporter [Cadophora gregata]KAK0108592.1 CorA metal ion transporter [Cadophora gregata]